MLFAVIFAETGLVVTPFLPGDSLLFAAGALAATGAMDITLVLALIAVAAILGNSVNYAIGRAIGPRVFAASDGTGWQSKLLNRKHLDRAHEFFEKHGAMAVVSSRFAPIIRTFVPFVAGAAAMSASKFLLYNVVGGVSVDRDLRRRGLRVRQRAGHQEQLLPGRARHRRACRCCRWSSRSCVPAVELRQGPEVGLLRLERLSYGRL